MQVLTKLKKLLPTQKKITYTENLLGESISRNIAFVFADLPLIRIIAEVCIFLCLEHGPTELHIWLSGEFVFRKARNKIV